MRILVVEDNAADAALLQGLVEQEADSAARLDVDIVASLSQAFKLLDANHYNLIITDLELLDVYGDVATVALRAQFPSTPLIVYSGQVNHTTREVAEQVGAFTVIEKSQRNSKLIWSSMLGAMATNSNIALAS